MITGHGQVSSDIEGGESEALIDWFRVGEAGLRGGVSDSKSWEVNAPVARGGVRQQLATSVSAGRPSGAFTVSGVASTLAWLRKMGLRGQGKGGGTRDHICESDLGLFPSPFSPAPPPPCSVRAPQHGAGSGSVGGVPALLPPAVVPAPSAAEDAGGPVGGPGLLHPVHSVPCDDSVRPLVQSGRSVCPGGFTLF